MKDSEATRGAPGGPPESEVFYQFVSVPEKEILALERFLLLELGFRGRGEVLRSLVSRWYLDRYLLHGWFPQFDLMEAESHLLLGALYHRLWPLRFDIQALRSHPSHRKIRRGAKGFRMEFHEGVVLNETVETIYRLYRREKAPFQREGIEEIVPLQAIKTGIYFPVTLLIWDGPHLVACGYFYRGLESVASILHFYHPNYHRHSPGKLLMLLTLDYLRQNALRWYYPGYVIASYPKFDYKLFLGKDNAQLFAPTRMTDLMFFSWRESENPPWEPFDENRLRVRPRPMGHTFTFLDRANTPRTHRPRPLQPPPALEKLLRLLQDEEWRIRHPG